MAEADVRRLVQQVNRCTCLKVGGPQLEFRMQGASVLPFFRAPRRLPLGLLLSLRIDLAQAQLVDQRFVGVGHWPRIQKVKDHPEVSSLDAIERRQRDGHRQAALFPMMQTQHAVRIE